MMRPVGVGRTSPGPIGVEGLTMTDRQVLLGHHLLDHAFGDDFAVFVGADGGASVERKGLVARHAVRLRLQRRDA